MPLIVFSLLLFAFAYLNSSLLLAIMAPALTITTDIMSSTKFPAYDDSIMDTFDSPTNKLIDQVIRTPGREPSPQPTHFSLPYKNGNGNGHRVLRSATVGYIAPEFTGKKAQQTQGESFLCM